MKLIPALVVIFALAGCTTLNTEKTLIVTPEPNETKIAVSAHSTAKCFDAILFDWCRLDLTLDRQR